MTKAPARRPPGPAATAHAQLVAQIRAFEADLDPQHEIAMGFAGGDAGTLRIAGLGFQEPGLLTFYGFDEEGRKTQLVQHVSQLSVILRAVPRKEDTPRRIGFRLQNGWLGGDAGDASV